MIEKDFVLLILNCKAYKHKAEKQRKTWLKTLPSNIDYYHVVGDLNMNKPYLFNKDEKILYLKCKDDYNSLPKKVILSFEAIKKEYNFKYIFKTDDDQELIKPNFFTSFTKLLTINPYHYGGFSLEVPTHISTYFMVHDCLPRNLLLEKTKYCNGRFYFLSNSAINDVLNKKNIIEKAFIEDHAIGLNLSSKFKENMLHFDTKKVFKDGTL